MDANNLIYRFVFEDTNIRGQFVRLHETWRMLHEKVAYPHTVQTLLGQACAATSLLSTTLKFEGSFTLQIAGSGPITLLVVQATSDRTMRGLAKWNADVTTESIGAAFGSDRLCITVDSVISKTKYQSIVELKGNSLSESLEHYLSQSEQLPTRLWLSTCDECVSGLLIQKLPGDDSDANTWYQVVEPAKIFDDQALLFEPVSSLLQNLFTGQSIRLFRGKPIFFACTCSTEIIKKVLCSFGQDECNAILQDEGNITVTCEYCQEQYCFDQSDIRNLFVHSNLGNTHH